MSVSVFVCRHENNTQIQFWCVAAVVTVFLVTCNDLNTCCQNCDGYVSNNHSCTFPSSLLSPPSLLVWLLSLSPLAFLPHCLCRLCFWLSNLPRIQSAEYMFCDHIVPDTFGTFWEETGGTFCDWFLLSQSSVFGGTKKLLFPLPSCLGVAYVVTEKLRRR